MLVSGALSEGIEENTVQQPLLDDATAERLNGTLVDRLICLQRADTLVVSDLW